MADYNWGWIGRMCEASNDTSKIYNCMKVLGDNQPVAMQMSWIDIPFAHAHEEAIPLEE